MNDIQKIIGFIKGTLGCQCPDEIFQNVNIQENFRLNMDIKLKYRIIAGNRLLLYIVDVDDASFVHEHLPTVMFFGRDEKELKGFKTFRLALAAPEPDKIRPAAESIFEDLATIMDLGEGIHLHVVSQGDVAW